MPIADYGFALRTGLSDFWIRFFNDGPTLDAMYQGTSVLLGQAYLDYLSSVLGVSMRDALALDRELYQLVTIREDQVSFVEGATVPANRWSFQLPSPVVDVQSLDNKTFEPTASLEVNLDYELASGTLLFLIDPTDTDGHGTPLPGFARRTVDVDTGGQFTDSGVADWLGLASPARKGDVVRILDVGVAGQQRKKFDCAVVLARSAGLFVNPSAPLPPPATGVKYVLLRTPAAPAVSSESFTLVAGSARLAHTRVDQGSLKIFAKGPTGADVVEGVDFAVNYESGTIAALTAWQGAPGPFSANYSWKEEVYPATGASPRLSSTGVIVSTAPATTTALEIAAWAPDALVDKMTLANNFGAMIGRAAPSSEAYRNFLRGIFQLYVLGPVIDRMESALNVVMGFPVVRDDGETYQSTDLSSSEMDVIYTKNPVTGFLVTYSFPKGTPLRSDLAVGQVLSAFEVLTTALTVTDYVQTPNWWESVVIPSALFTPVGGSVPSVVRRTSSPAYVLNVVNPIDGAQVGDPGLIVGADEVGFVPPPGHPVFRHRVAYVLMDRYMKYHSFFVTFNATAISALVGNQFPQSLNDLNDLVLSARPSHTYPFTIPSTFLSDSIEIDELSISFDRLVGSRVFGPDEVIITDGPPTIGSGVWHSGDFFHYELFTASTAFPVLGTPVTLSNAPTPPRTGRLVRVFLDGNVGGVALVENVDYAVNYANRTVTRLTAWASSTVNVTFRQLNIGNLSSSSMASGDMALLVDGVDPALIAPAYNPAASGWDGTVEPATAPRDIGLIERALIVNPH